MNRSGKSEDWQENKSSTEGNEENEDAMLFYRKDEDAPSPRY
jgi:hypothetical protein